MVGKRGNRSGLYDLWQDSHRRSQSAPPDINQILATMMQNNNNNNNPKSSPEQQPQLYNNNNNNPSLDSTSLFSTATVHENEAEKRIIEAVEMERQERLRELQQQQQQQQQQFSFRNHKNDRGATNTMATNTTNTATVTTTVQPDDFPTTVPSIYLPDNRTMEDDGYPTRSNNNINNNNSNNNSNSNSQHLSDGNDDDNEDDNDERYDNSTAMPPSGVSPPAAPSRQPSVRQPRPELQRTTFSFKAKHEPSSSLVLSTRYLLALQEVDQMESHSHGHGHNRPRPSPSRGEEETHQQKEDKKELPGRRGFFGSSLRWGRGGAAAAARDKDNDPTVVGALVDSLDNAASGGGGGGDPGVPKPPDQVTTSWDVDRMTEAAATVIRNNVTTTHTGGPGALSKQFSVSTIFAEASAMFPPPTHYQPPPSEQDEILGSLPPLPPPPSNPPNLTETLEDLPEDDENDNGGGKNINRRRYSNGSLRSKETMPPPSSNGGESHQEDRYHLSNRTYPLQKKDKLSKKATDTLAREWESLFDFFKPRTTRMEKELVQYILTFLLPSLGIAFVLFYLADNPPTGRCTESNVNCGLSSNGKPRASISWWVLFLGTRQVITWLLARGLDAWSIDWLLLQHPLICRWLGPRFTLLILQSKGWPSILFWWCLLDAAVLYGAGTFPQHWLYWQDELAIFTKENPSGNVTTNSWYRNFLVGGVLLSLAVTIKRDYVGLHLGRRLYSRFHDRLEVAMKHIALMCEFALWVRNHENRHHHHHHHEHNKPPRRPRRSLFRRSNMDPQTNNHNPSFPTTANHISPIKNAANHAARTLQQEANNAAFDKHDESNFVSREFAVQHVGNGNNAAAAPFSRNNDGDKFPYSSTFSRNYYGNNSSSGAKPTKGLLINYDKLLDPWTEPQRANRLKHVQGNQIVEFRQAFALMTKPFVFSSAFGPMEFRDECIRTSERFFHRIVAMMEEEYENSNNNNKNNPPSIDLDKLMYMMFQGYRSEAERERAEDLLELLNPDCNGNIEELDFIKAIDRVYKEVRLLESAILNASHLDREYERMINYLFYLALACAFYAMLGLDLMTLILTLTGFVVAFSFMFGPGSAQLFEGVLMVLGRQPFDVGDRVCIQATEAPASLGGSPHWIVEEIDLVSTKARLGATCELATLSNGAIARSRVLNFHRSPDPLINIYVRFETDIPYSTILIFKAAVQKFIDERPQLWHKTINFRTSRIESQLNFVEYMIVCHFRKPWSEFGELLEAKAAVETFCVELLKQMGCHYKAPSKPIHIRENMLPPNFRNHNQQNGNDPGDDDVSSMPDEDQFNWMQALAETTSGLGEDDSSQMGMHTPTRDLIPFEDLTTRSFASSRTLVTKNV